MLAFKDQFVEQSTPGLGICFRPQILKDVCILESSRLLQHKHPLMLSLYIALDYSVYVVSICMCVNRNTLGSDHFSPVTVFFWPHGAAEMSCIRNIVLALMLIELTF